YSIRKIRIPAVAAWHQIGACYALRALPLRPFTRWRLQEELVEVYITALASATSGGRGRLNWRGKLRHRHIGRERGALCGFDDTNGDETRLGLFWFPVIEDWLFDLVLCDDPIAPRTSVLLDRIPADHCGETDLLAAHGAGAVASLEGAHRLSEMTRHRVQS